MSYGEGRCERIDEDGESIDIAIGSGYEGVHPETYTVTGALELIGRIQAAVDAVVARKAACAEGHEWDTELERAFSHIRVCVRRGCVAMERDREATL